MCYSSADVLLPDFNKTDAKKWAVIACDQFTSEPEYWESVKAEVGDAPSTLGMILPEVYLSDAAERMPVIRENMKKYLDGTLTCHEDTMIYVRRTQSDGSIRHGIVLCVDLECYDYRRGASSLIRATEATVVERIPPRVAIRRGAEIELPHIMLLIDDPDRTVIEPLESSEAGELAYDTELMLGGGHVRGTFLTKEQVDVVCASLNALTDAREIRRKYGDGEMAPLLFAVGDGNHSLASAKAAYEEIKARIGEDAAINHPARYAMAEVVNIHDPALKFEPIYRVMFGVDAKDVLNRLEAYAKELYGSAPAQTVRYITRDTQGEIIFDRPIRQLTVGTLQNFIDEYVSTHPDASVDYIHGEDSTAALAKGENAIGFIFSGMEKSELFKTVIFDGALPRKTFSMGHAQDKRYYLECRKISV